jgi:hypothetical protein
VKHVVLPKFGLWRTPAAKSRQISFRFFGYHKFARTVVIPNLTDINFFGKRATNVFWEWAENSGEWAKKLTKIAVEKESGLHYRYRIAE